jgi:hypothetical protein
MLLRELQTLLNRLYDIRVEADVYDFLVTDPNALPVAHAAAKSDEQLLVRQQGDTIHVALYLAREVLERLTARDPMRRLDAHNIADYWTALEGVSHFQYLAWNAHHDRPVSLHELEVQAEVDKYAVTLFVLGGQHAGRFPARLHEWLFARARIDGELTGARRELYASANRYAARFCALLERRFLKRGRLRCEALVRELRAFYRMTHAPKIRHIEAARAA